MHEWLQRVSSFFEQLESRAPGSVQQTDHADPLERSAIVDLSSGFEHPIPEPLIQFYTTVASTTKFRYFVNEPYVYGGPCFFPPHEFEYGFDYCRQWGEPIAEDAPECGELWLNSLVFAVIDNGDALGFDMRVTPDNPPVVYLDHEGESHRPLAENFWDFLHRWERLCYAGPEIWMLEDYIHPETGLLDFNCDAAIQLRSKLGSPVPNV